jgi:hypothetical protein
MAAAETLYNKDGSEKSKALLYHFVDSVVAMDVALQEVCANAGIDPMTVRKLACCADEYVFVKCGDKCGIESLVKEYIELFAGFLM